MDLDEVVGGDDVSDLVRMPDPNADKANSHRGKPLENLLMAKNRKLQDELTNMRVAHEELFAAHRMISTDVEALQSRLEEQRALNERLENDLLGINQAGAAGPSMMGSAGAPVREDPLAGLSLGKKVRRMCNWPRRCRSRD